MIARIAAAASARVRALTLVSALAGAGALQLLDISPAVSQTTSLVAMRVEQAPGLDPDDSVWKRVPEVEVALTAQSVTYPFGGGGLPAARVQALHDSSTLSIRISWDDSTSDTRTVASEDFADAVAVQFPAVAESSTPAVCMGQADRGVNIWHWRADSQRGLPKSVEELHADGYVDLYPSTEDLFFPAREAGNPYAVPSAGPVQDLVAVGFGTLGPAADQTVTGQAQWDRDQWTVVLARSFASTDDHRPSFAVGTTTDMAVAAWNGDAGDRNGQKSVSPFVRLSITGEDLPPAPRSDLQVLAIVGATVGVLFALVLGLAYLTDPWRRSR